MYESGKKTVLCNESGTVLNLRINEKSNITLHPTRGVNFIDVEDACDEKELRGLKQLFERLTDEGEISWHPTGSKPVASTKPAMRLPAEGETVTVPPNRYDAAINRQNEKEKKEDEKTKVAGQTRTERKEPDEENRPVGAPSEDRSLPSNDPFKQWGVGQILEHAVKFDVVTKAGNYFKMGDETIGRGFKSACSKLEQDVALLDRLKIRLPAA